MALVHDCFRLSRAREDTLVAGLTVELVEGPGAHDRDCWGARIVGVLDRLPLRPAA